MNLDDANLIRLIALEVFLHELWCFWYQQQFTCGDLDLMLLFGLMTSGFDAFSPCFNNLDGVLMTTSLVCF